MTVTVENTHPDRIRLQNEKNALRSFDKLADKYSVNPRYVWEFIQKGIVPPKKICKKLGIQIDPPPPLRATQKRNAELNAIARELGYESWSNYGTRLIEKRRNREL